MGAIKIPIIIIKTEGIHLPSREWVKLEFCCSQMNKETMKTSVKKMKKNDYSVCIVAGQYPKCPKNHSRPLPLGAV